jgi:uncharacterized protein (DUF486 family)
VVKPTAASGANRKHSFPGWRNRKEPDDARGAADDWSVADVECLHDIALFEYLLQVPANRIGYQHLSLPQLKILQEVITLSVFVPFSVLYMGQPLRRDFLWAALCLVGAVYFVFRDKGTG